MARTGLSNADQEILRITFDSIDQGITIYDDNLRLIAWNHRYSKMGLHPKRLLYFGARLFDLYHDIAQRGAFGAGDPAALARKHIDAIRTGPLIESETLYAPSGQVLRIRRFRLPGGGICATFSDITEEIQIEADRRRAQRAEAIGKLTGGVAHDFNNLLAIIGHSIELALNLSDDPKLRERLRPAMEAVDRGAGLTHRLLAFASRQPLSPEPLRPSVLLDGLSTLLRQLAGESIDVVLSTGNSDWQCQADRVQLENVIVNLVANARDAMPSGGTLTLRVTNVTFGPQEARIAGVEPGDYVDITVQDTGSGMSREVMERAFDPFFTTKGEGTGLGLSMAHGFARQSKGCLRMESEVEHGTRATLYLPRTRPARTADDSVVDKEHLPNGGTERVLVVEDEPSLRSLIVQQLATLGYEVESVADGPDAMQALHAQTFDLLLSDLVLPGGMNGNQLYGAARAIHSDLPVLFMTGYSEISIEADAPVIQKPFRIAQLAHSMRQVLDAPRSP